MLDAHIIGFSLWQASHSYTDEQMSDMAGTLDRMIPEHPFLIMHSQPSRQGLIRTRLRQGNVVQAYRELGATQATFQEVAGQCVFEKNAGQLRCRLDAHRLGDGRAPVAALGHEPGVAEAFRQRDPGTRDPGRIPSGDGRLGGEPVTGQRGNDQVERVPGGAVELGGLGRVVRLLGPQFDLGRGE